MVRKTLVGAALAAVLITAACAPLNPGVSARAQSEATSLTKARDDRRISWSQWARGMSAIARREMPEGGSLRDLVLANVEVTAERVDAGRMTPAEGRLEVATIMAALEHGASGESAAPQSASAAQSSPQTVRCRNEGVGIMRQFVCDSY